MSKSLRPLTNNKRWEQIAQVAHQKWVTLSKSLRLLTKNEQMSELLFFLANRSFAHFFANKQEFAQKTDERIPNPDVHCTVWYSILLLTEILEYAWHRGEGNLEPVGAVIFLSLVTYSTCHLVPFYFLKL